MYPRMSITIPTPTAEPSGEKPAIFSGSWRRPDENQNHNQADEVPDMLAAQPGQLVEQIRAGDPLRVWMRIPSRVHATGLHVERGVRSGRGGATETMELRKRSETMKTYWYGIYRHGSNNANQSMCDRSLVCQVEAPNREKAEPAAHELGREGRFTLYANQHLSAKPLSQIGKLEIDGLFMDEVMEEASCLVCGTEAPEKIERWRARNYACEKCRGRHV